MATITYDGVEGAEGGNIFKEVNFWVAQRIPSRQHYLELIKSNGGRVVPLERDADMLIADHARKDVPPGSYSWTFIQDSVKNGIIQLKDRYAIGRDPKEPRAVASASTTKFGRIPFTAADDAALVRWVLSHRNARTGNIIYQQYEQMNPRHTWQSWQNRWRKKLQNYTHEQLEMILLQNPEDAEPQPETSAPPAPPAPSTPARTRNGAQAATVQDNQSRAVKEQTLRDEVEEGEPGPETEQQQEQTAPPQHEGPPTTQTAGSDAYISSDSNREQFYKDLQAFVATTEVDINPLPTIGGKPLELYDLAQTVMDKEILPEQDFDWQQVAADLGYDCPDQDLIAEIMHCWVNSLQDFLEFMVTFEAGEEERRAEEAGTGDLEDADDEGIAEVLPDPSPSANRRKRSRDEASSSNSGTKRRRLDPDTVIPSTPEERLLPTARGAESVVQESPTVGRRRQPRRQLLPTDTIQDSQDDTQARALTPTGARTPRSVDLGLNRFRTPRPTLKTQQSSYDITPSQQLHIEAGSPDGFDPGRRQRDTSSEPDEPTPLLRRRTARPTPSVPKPAPQNASKRRSLPSSFQKPQPRSPPNQPQPPPSNQRQQQPPPPPSSTATSSRPKPSARPIYHTTQDEGPSHPNRGNPHTTVSEPITIVEWVDHYQSLGYPHDLIVTAMNATTMTPGSLLTPVLESLSGGNGIPTHIQGVWTTRDDTALRSLMSLSDDDLQREDARDPEDRRRLAKARRDRKRLEAKHSVQRVEIRRMFIQSKDEYEKSIAEQAGPFSRPGSSH